MAFLIVLAALCFLMLAAYRGYSVILFAPVAVAKVNVVKYPTLAFGTIGYAQWYGHIKAQQ